jgi:hypothetical protein
MILTTPEAAGSAKPAARGAHKSERWQVGAGKHPEDLHEIVRAVRMPRGNGESSSGIVLWGPEKVASLDERPLQAIGFSPLQARRVTPSSTSSEPSPT